MLQNKSIFKVIEFIKVIIFWLNMKYVCNYLVFFYKFENHYEKKTPLFYFQAIERCQSKNGTLASIKSRDAWFTLTMLIKTEFGRGKEAFYISKLSDPYQAKIHLIKHNLSLKDNSTSIIVNIMDDTNVVPPQFDLTRGLDQLFYYCEFPPGRTIFPEKIASTTINPEKLQTVEDDQINDGKKYKEDIEDIFYDEKSIEEIERERIEVINRYDAEYQENKGLLDEIEIDRPDEDFTEADFNLDYYEDDYFE